MTASPPIPDDPDRQRWTRRRWRAAGPALIAVLLIGRTFAVGGVDAPIGLAIAAALLVIAALAHRPTAWTAPLLLVGPVALLASPARTELSFSLARPDETGWFLFTVATAFAVGLCIAATLDATTSRAWTTATGVAAAGIAALLGAAGFAAAVSAIDPQPDLGAALDARERAELPEIGLVNFAFALPGDALDDYVVTDTGQDRFRARLDNSSDVPHTFTIEALGLDVYVPAGREAVVDVAMVDADDTVFEVVCLVGDHVELGMVATLR